MGEGVILDAHGSIALDTTVLTDIKDVELVVKELDTLSLALQRKNN